VEQAGQVFLRAAQIATISGIIGTVIGILLAADVLNLPLVVGGLALIGLSIFLIAVMPESAAKRRGQHTEEPESPSYKAMLDTLREGWRLVRGNSLLLTILAIEIFFGAYSEGFDRLWETHFLKTFTFPAIGTLPPIVWIGAINLGSRLIVLAGVEIARRRVNTNSHIGVARALYGLNSVLSASMVIFGMAGSFVVGVGAFWSARLMRSTIEPLADAWLNQHVESHVRATTFSMRAQVNALGQVAGGPAIGLIADALGLRAAMIISGILLTPALWLYRRAMRHDPAPVAAQAVQQEIPAAK
jgi:DHA3 family tetracycline resistance protein-like MFS transporter